MTECKKPCLKLFSLINLSHLFWAYMKILLCTCKRGLNPIDILFSVSKGVNGSLLESFASLSFTQNELLIAALKEKSFIEY